MELTLEMFKQTRDAYVQALESEDIPEIMERGICHYMNKKYDVGLSVYEFVGKNYRDSLSHRRTYVVPTIAHGVPIDVAIPPRIKLLEKIISDVESGKVRL